MLNHYRNGTGEPLVLIHGIGSRWQMWEAVLDRLVAHRDVIALDLSGFGGSAMLAAGTPAGPASLTSLVHDFLTEIGVTHPHVAGNSARMVTLHNCGHIPTYDDPQQVARVLLEASAPR